MKYEDILMVKLPVFAKQEFIFYHSCEKYLIHHFSNKGMAFTLRKLESSASFIR